MRRHIPDSPGLSRPEWMDDEEYAEYRFSEEARYELTYEPDEPDFFDDFDFDFDRADAWAEHEAELEEDRRYMDGEEDEED